MRDSRFRNQFCSQCLIHLNIGGHHHPQSLSDKHTQLDLRQFSWDRVCADLVDKV